MSAVSALVHTRNEAAVVGPCLESLRWADELVVADMGSTDDTREIARRAGARIVDVPVVSLVDTVRNQAVEACAGPWVLVVDADERVPPTLAAHLREIAGAEAATAAADAYAIPRQNRFLGVWLEHGFWPDRQVRFFKKGAARWTDHVHEPPQVTAGRRLAELPADPALAFDHPGYGPDLVRFVEKLVRYAPLDARRLRSAENPAVFPWLLRRPLSEFTNRYFRDGAWRYGMHGLVWSGLQGVYQFLVAAHLWALLRERGTAADSTDEVLSPETAERLRRGTRREAWRAAARLLRRD